MASIDEEVVMTPSKKGNVTHIKIERKKKQNVNPEDVVHVAGGQHQGLVVNRPDAKDEDLGKPQLQLGFLCFLVDLKTDEHYVESRKLKFWYVEGCDYYNQVTTAYEFFKELVRPENFPRDYVGFIKKCMKQMQSPRYTLARKVDLEVEHLDAADAPMSPGFNKKDDRPIEEIIREKLLTLLESAYPNVLSVEDLVRITGADQSMVQLQLQELLSKELISAMENGGFVRKVLDDKTVDNYKKIVFWHMMSEKSDALVHNAIDMISQSQPSTSAVQMEASQEKNSNSLDLLESGSEAAENSGAIPDFLSAKWDPDDPTDAEVTSPPSPSCIRRIKNDILAIYSEPPPGLCVLPDPNNITKIHALLTGPFDTPYEGGFFYFLIRFPSEYPISPPRVRLMTTGNGTVRFNPNLYKNGKVCLSILGTWAGPSWSPAQTLSTVLISIQSLMNEKPYHNEPGFKHERTSGDSKHYNTIIQHETIRVAVCDMIEGNIKIPDTLRAVMESSFPDYYKYYVQVCESHLHLDGMDMNDPFGDTRPKFDFKTCLKRLKSIKSRLDNARESDDEDDDKSSDIEEDINNS